MRVLIYDCETTGLYQPSLPSAHPDQPHIVQAAAQLVDAHGNVLEEFEAIVKPDGWTIPGEATEIHGITTERALDEGFPADDVLHQLLCMQARATLRTGYNQPFDARIVRIGLYRHARGLDAAYGHHIDAVATAPGPAIEALREAVADWWNYGIAQYDVMRTMKDIMQLPGRKYPKLAEAFAHATGETMVGAHTAMGDVDATRRVLQWLLDHDHVRLDADWALSDLAFRADKHRDKIEARKSYA